MTALIIILVIAVIFALILLCPVGARISCDSFDENSPVVKLIIGFIAITIIPRPKKKIRLSDYSPKKLRRKRLSAAKKKKEKAQKPQAEQAQKKKPKKKRSIRDTAAILRYYLRCAVILLGKFGRRIRVRVYDFAIVISGDDPAQTAITYGYVSQLAAYFLGFIRDNANVSFSKKAVCTVNFDFSETKPCIFADVKFTVRIIHIISLAFGVLSAYLKRQDNTKNK